MKGAAIKYSAKELKWIKAHSKLPRLEALNLFVKKFKRSDVSLSNFKALCKRNGWKTGRTGFFIRGHVPCNKGKKMPYNANTASTQFKKGNVPHNTKYPGHERITKDGYIELSVEEINPHTGYKTRYVLKHRYFWEKQHGKIPKGKYLKCLDGNKQNTNPSNWDCINKALAIRLNGNAGRSCNYDNAPKDLKPIIMMTAKLEHAVREASKV